MTPQSPRLPLASGFTIDKPTLGEPVCGDANNYIRVQVTRTDSAITRFQAVIYPIGSGSGAGIPVDLVREGSSEVWSGLVYAGNLPNLPPGSNNRTLRVTSYLGTTVGDSEAVDFIASRCGSGSGSGSCQEIAALAALRERFTQKDTPIPVSVVLTLDSPVEDGTSIVSAQLNASTPLVHARDAQHFSSWVSAPIVFCSISGETGHWILDKTAPRAWTLQLKRPRAAVATYVLHTPDDRDATFPLSLALQGGGGCECTGWPRTVTITLAP